MVSLQKPDLFEPEVGFLQPSNHHRRRNMFQIEGAGGVFMLV